MFDVIQTGAHQLKVVSDVCQLFLVLVQLERRAGDVVVLLDLIMERRVREVRVGGVEQRTCTQSQTTHIHTHTQTDIKSALNRLTALTQ